MKEIKSVIFDWGGVIIDDPREHLVHRCAKAPVVLKEDYTKVHESYAKQLLKNTRKNH